MSAYTAADADVQTPAGVIQPPLRPLGPRPRLGSMPLLAHHKHVLENSHLQAACPSAPVNYHTIKTEPKQIINRESAVGNIRRGGGGHGWRQVKVRAHRPPRPAPPRREATIEHAAIDGRVSAVYSTLRRRARL